MKLSKKFKKVTFMLITFSMILLCVLYVDLVIAVDRGRQYKFLSYIPYEFVEWHYNTYNDYPKDFSLIDEFLEEFDDVGFYKGIRKGKTLVLKNVKIDEHKYTADAVFEGLLGAQVTIVIKREDVEGGNRDKPYILPHGTERNGKR